MEATTSTRTSPGHTSPALPSPWPWSACWPAWDRPGRDRASLPPKPCDTCSVIRLLPLAFRNLLRAKRRNALAGGTMALAVAGLVVGGGLVDGIARQLMRSLVAVQTGHVALLI